jgi:alanyl-tRNA synthetase
MDSKTIRTKFLEFFKSKEHLIIPSSSLVTPDEKGVTNSTLFNTAGMQPLVPYLLGKPYLKDGKEYSRLANSQKCLRTVDIDDVGDNTHATFFEMLGNWSLGDYFKNEAINWSYEFLTDKTVGLGLDPQRLYVTVFEGDENAPRDNEAHEIWQKIFKENGVEGERIFFMGADKNWWEAGENGPCGPDSEMYYDVKNKFGGRGLTRDGFISADNERGHRSGRRSFRKLW